ncbi:hypothetical protein ACJX0J_028070, partial [Zea mays]
MIPILHMESKIELEYSKKEKGINYNIISEFIQKYKRIFYIYILMILLNLETLNK